MFFKELFIDIDTHTQLLIQEVEAQNPGSTASLPTVVHHPMPTKTIAYVPSPSPSLNEVSNETNSVGASSNTETEQNVSSGDSLKNPNINNEEFKTYDDKDKSDPNVCIYFLLI